METLLKSLCEERPKKLHWKTPKGMFLPVYKCRCGEIQIHNFSELKITKTGNYSRLVERDCSDCGLVFSRTWWTTAGRSPRRLIDWLRIGLFLLETLPAKWYQKIQPVIFWLEVRVPV